MRPLCNSVHKGHVAQTPALLTHPVGQLLSTVLAQSHTKTFRVALTHTCVHVRVWGGKQKFHELRPLLHTMQSNLFYSVLFPATF